MPSQLPSSFASAAAGQIRDNRGPGRGENVRGSGSGDWPRSNGTRTFRRPSTAPYGQAASATSTDPSQHPAGDAPPMSANPQSAHFDTNSLRYSKDDMLEIYKNIPESAQIDPSSLFVSTWNPNQSQTNGSSSRGWGKSGESAHVPQDPTVCWDPSGSQGLASLEDMSPEEQEMFATDVNSTLKLPQQNKEGGNQNSGQNGRKTSVSVGSTAANYPMSSPSTASRPGTRRRETTDTNPFPNSGLASPSAGRFSRDEPWFPRRSTELREPITDEPEEDINPREPPPRSATFGVPRSNTGGAATFAAAPSLWGASASAASAGGVGAFGSFALNTAAIGDKRFATGIGAGTGGSRLAHLIPKDENVIGKSGDVSSADTSRGWRPRQRTDTDPFGGEGNLSGSAVLGGAQDHSPPNLPSQLQRGSVFDTPVKGSTGDFGMTGLNLGNQGDANGPVSPSETNPYRSPLAERGEDSYEDNDLDRAAQPGLGSEPASAYGTLPRQFGSNAFEGSDRSQTSSVGAKGFPTVNTMTGWPAVNPAGTPDRERQPFNSAFGGSIFGPLGDLQSPSLGGLGGVFGPPGASGLGRGSKLGSLFPLAMQAQMHGQEQENLGDSVPDLRQGNPLGAIGRGPIGPQSRETGSPVRPTRGTFEDLFSSSDAARVAFTTAEHLQPGLTATSQQSFSASTAGPSFPAAQATGDPSSVRTMVMPDRMRWVYLDPQGTMQGPFSGLEMNDWYKANFFNPDLRVKRLEDNDFEPLGQLIRRIGNSREPFLVPQMGIAHGPPPSAPFALPGSEAVPPLQNAFPSFGRTLTAAQQNDLERRKQEEQLYHARQRELAHHHQAYSRVPMQPGAPGSLHHHSSAHSLQSQPSFGSMTSPIGMAPQPPIGPLAPNSAFFDASVSMALPGQPGIGAGPDLFSPDLNLSERQLLANMQASSGLPGNFPAQPMGAPGGEGISLRSQLPGIDQLQKDSQGFSARIKEFHDLRAQHDAEEAANASAAAIAALAAMKSLAGVREEVVEDEDAAPAPVSDETKETTDSRAEATGAKATAYTQQELSLAEKVMKTQANAVAAAHAVAKPVQQASLSGLPMPFPPPAQSTTIVAPTAQRPASNLPTRYDDRSASGTPDTTSDVAVLAPPPTAPWAPQPGIEAHKGPSLKEIQEAEAKKAAKREEAATAMRRAALEQEAAALREREKAAAVNIGLPATSTWGTGSPVGAPAAGSAWKQPATAAKGSVVGVASGSAASKKTLADIQREEESRKLKAREAALQTTAAVTAAAGKRYADLASKVTPPGLSSAATPPAIGGGWSTVGAGGKVKIPTGPAAQTRSVSVGTAKVLATPPVTKSVVKQQSVGLKDAKGVALEEFKKWLHRELARGLIGVADIETFAATLMEMPLEAQLLADAAYCYSTTMDGRHFADEFVRRRKLADKGMFEKDAVIPSASESKNSNGGWSEVAKKGGNSAPKEDANLLAGCYVDVLYTDRAQTLIKGFVGGVLASQQVNNTTTTENGDTIQNGTHHRNQNQNESANQASIAVGLAAFNAFLQTNVTGPVLDGLRRVEGQFIDAAPGLGTSTLQQVRRACFRSLDVDGVSVYPYIPCIELFCLARWVFTTVPASGVELEGEGAGRSLAWLRLRADVWLFKLLTQPSLGAGSVFVKGAQWSDVPSLQAGIEEGLGAVERVVFDQAGRWTAEEKVMWLVEKANVFIMLGQGNEAKEALGRAREVTKSGAEVGVEASAKPEALALNDDTVLENLRFTDENAEGEENKADSLPEVLKDLVPDDQPQLSPLDQIILLTEATLKDAFSPADTLTAEEILPFAVRVISDKSTNWQTYTQALLVRSRTEVHRSRTMERGILQMQAVVDQVIVDTTAAADNNAKRAESRGSEPETTVPVIRITADGEVANDTLDVEKPTSFFPASKSTDSAPAHIRLQYIHALSSPPRWHLESELAYSWASVGSLVSALEIFKRLRLWAEVALCLASNAENNDEDGRGHNGEEKAKAIIRWRLFHRTGVTKTSADEPDETTDISGLKQADYHGPERSPAPPNAPRLWCILGDIEQDPTYYERAWEISKHRYFRAQKSLGEYYLKQNDLARAKAAYTMAVTINRMSSEMWSRLGDINLRIGEFSEASDAFGRAISCTDNNLAGGEDARTWSNLGSALYSLYVERVKEMQKEKEEKDSQPTEALTNGSADSDDEDTAAAAPKPAKSTPTKLLTQSLAAYKRGASIAHDNWRIWDNVITIGSRLRPLVVWDILLALRNVMRIRKTEDALDIDVLRLLLNEAVLNQPKRDDGPGPYDPPRGTPERAVCELIESQIVPLITVRDEFWELVTRERVWKRDYAGAVDAAERAWRAAIGAAAGGGLLPAAGGGEGKVRNWLEDREGWVNVVERTDELVSVLENYGGEVPAIGAKWKGKARSAVRSVLGKAKEVWEGTEEWERLGALLEGLR
ncbi:gyf domain-containing protein [Lasiosphaeria hispida]|uniref:Gyf domain-containing protein n=1 Tax=Lasiosphaeria hispida TaxID=260671 RepID=A0AAJ0MEZ3_9PEZI|nr:gyf domain-containing protein [Lasiosphaeria hispida]